MKLTPIDIQQQQFKSALLGVDKNEVDAFLDQVAAAFEELIREVNTLKAASAEKDAQLEGHRERERALKETMITATRIAGEVKAQAEKEAELLIEAAEKQAEGVVAGAQARLAKVLDDIAELKRQRAQLEAGLRSIVGAHAKLLDSLAEREGEPDGRRGKVTPIAAAKEDEERRVGQGR